MTAILVRWRSCRAQQVVQAVELVAPPAGLDDVHARHRAEHGLDDEPVGVADDGAEVEECIGDDAGRDEAVGFDGAERLDQRQRVVTTDVYVVISNYPYGDQHTSYMEIKNNDVFIEVYDTGIAPITDGITARIQGWESPARKRVAARDQTLAHECPVDDLRLPVQLTTLS